VKFQVAAASAVFSFCVLSSIVPPGHAASRTPTEAKNVYVVVLRDLPAAARAAKGQRMSRLAPQVAQRAEQLTARHDAMLSAIGGARKIYSYSHALNGFAAELNKAQVDKLRADPNVVSVARNEIRKLATITTPAFLGLTAANGAWDQLGGGNGAGDNVIVGVIDTGIWPEHPSFAPRPVHNGPAPGWNGICQSGQKFPASSCNNKLIGARWYDEGFGGNAAIKSLFPYEYLSPRAADGHGVHTASTAVGDYLVDAEAAGVKLGRVSGMAPGARLAVYKACWGYDDDANAGCSTVDSVAAIDQAVADGVDVINFSVGGSLTSDVDPVEFAFLIAADAGVFVSAAAGNEGAQGPSTVEHNSPWVTAVGIGTHDRTYKAAVVFADGRRFEGTSVDNRGVGDRNVVLARDSAAAGVSPDDAALCLPGTLKPKAVQGRIVVCDRGVNDRVEKSQVVDDAGGVGMILVNVVPGTLNADIHSVPTVHLGDSVGAQFKRFLALNPNLKAHLTPGTLVTGPVNPAPNLSQDSSRGPALAGFGDLLKPDLIAPGIDILAGYSPVRTGREFEFLSGSSMSTAVVSGLAALIKQAHPDWSPAAIKSALMTTAAQRRNDGERIRENEGDHAVANPFGIGAGEVKPNAALDPGLVYDAGLEDWLAFTCGTGEACFPPLAAIDPSDLNYPSIAIGDLVGEQVVHRRVTNVAALSAHYSVSIASPAGFKVGVTPSAFTLAPGATQAFAVRFTRTDAAPLTTYAFGSLTWSDGQHSVRSPIAVLPSPLAAPAQVSGNGEPINYSVTFGYTGPFKAVAHGLVPAATHKDVVRHDPAQDINTALATGRGIVIIPVTVPAGTIYGRFSLFDSDTQGDADLDLYVFDQNNNFLGGSASDSSNEEVDLDNPPPGQYQVVVHGFNTDGPSARFTLYSWALQSRYNGNMTLSAPTRAVSTRSATIGLKFLSLKTNERYLGSVEYSGATGLPKSTIVRVDR